MLESRGAEFESKLGLKAARKLWLEGYLMVNELRGMIKAKLFYSANFAESSVFITLSSCKSILFPTSIQTILGSACSLSSLNHFKILLKLSYFVIS